MKCTTQKSTGNCLLHFLSTVIYLSSGYYSPHLLFFYIQQNPQGKRVVVKPINHFLSKPSLCLNPTVELQSTKCLFQMTVFLSYLFKTKILEYCEDGIIKWRLNISEWSVVTTPLKQRKTCLSFRNNTIKVTICYGFLQINQILKQKVWLYELSELKYCLIDLPTSASQIYTYT